MISLELDADIFNPEEKCPRIPHFLLTDKQNVQLEELAEKYKTMIAGLLLVQNNPETSSEEEIKQAESGATEIIHQIQSLCPKRPPPKPIKRKLEEVVTVVSVSDSKRPRGNDQIGIPIASVDIKVERQPNRFPVRCKLYKNHLDEVVVTISQIAMLIHQRYEDREDRSRKIRWEVKSVTKMWKHEIRQLKVINKSGNVSTKKSMCVTISGLKYICTYYINNRMTPQSCKMAQVIYDTFFSADGEFKPIMNCFYHLDLVLPCDKCTVQYT